MKLDNDVLYRIADRRPAIEGWPDDGGEDESLARFQPLIEDIESLDVSVRHNDGWTYGDTFFGLFLYRKQDTFGGLGLYVALSRFGPIGIYGEERCAWGLGGDASRGSPIVTGYRGYPTLGNLYRVSDSHWMPIAVSVRGLMERHDVYLPTVEELAKPIGFALPQAFRDNANRGKSVVFELLFNDLY